MLYLLYPAKLYSFVWLQFVPETWTATATAAKKVKMTLKTQRIIQTKKHFMWWKSYFILTEKVNINFTVPTETTTVNGKQQQK